jgi:large subunit ribosomal protein L25
MADRIELEIAPRTAMGKAAKRLRKDGIIPANIFGHKQAPVAVQVKEADYDHLRRSRGTRGILSLRMPEAAPETALIRHVQRDPRTGKILHIDFFRVSLSERIEMKIPLRLVGESPAVKNEGGVLLHLLDTLEVECRAADIVDVLEVDISPITEIDGAIFARDVQLPPHYTLVTSPDEPVAKVAITRAEEAEEAAEAAEGAEQPAPAAPTTAPASAEEES